MAELRRGPCSPPIPRQFTARCGQMITQAWAEGPSAFWPGQGPFHLPWPQRRAAADPLPPGAVRA
eukprot:9496862-Alexandrium_andersonii.AAC.1